jgi:hypothetical protein
MAKAIKEMPYTPKPDNYFWFYIGDKYYRRMQPIPYKYKQPDIKYLKTNKYSTTTA